MYRSLIFDLCGSAVVSLSNTGFSLDFSTLLRYSGTSNQVITLESGWNVFLSSEEDCSLTYGVYLFDGSTYSPYTASDISISIAKDLIIDTSLDFGL